MLGQRLQEVRKMSGLLSSEVSHYLDVSLKAYLMMEKDDYLVGWDVVNRLCDLYGCKEKVFYDENEKIDLTDETGKADYDAIVAKGEIVVGYTVFAPIAYEKDGKLVGFDTELAEAVAEKLGLKYIRVHDLRHLHIAFLIEKGTQPLVISKRVGHDSVMTTMNIYGHLYPDKQKQLADMLNAEATGEAKNNIVDMKIEMRYRKAGGWR